MALAQQSNRLDVLLKEQAGISRARAGKLIEQGLVTVDGVTAFKAGTLVKEGQQIEYTLPEIAELPLEKEDLPLTILYQDKDLAVIDKPCGMVTHPAAGNETGTLVQALLFHLDQLSGIGGVRRPGIVHRLDKDTSGLMMVAKNDESHMRLSRMLKDREIEKHYLAVVEGEMHEDEGQIDKPIARSKKDRKKMAIDPQGREAHTLWRILARLRGATLLDVHILTGRTHQIRVHMASIGHPVAGDPIYGRKSGVKTPRLLLHAYRLKLNHPITGQSLEYTCMPPAPYQEAVRRLKKNPDDTMPWDD